MFAKALILSSVALLVSAVNYDVTVGGLNSTSDPILRFNPEFVNAVVGDTVTFHFQQKNHSVVQTSFNDVCHPLLDATTHAPVFQTQFHPVANTDTDFPTEVYTVTDASKPLWFFCSQKLHCGKGMVFSINCPATGTNSLDNFKAAAAAVGAQEAAAAASASSWSATATSDVYGGQTYAPVYAPTVTDTVTFGQSTWTTTYQSYADSPDATPVAQEGIVHTVTVGANGNLTYDPQFIQAAVRDTVKFVFAAKNHTVTQSSFADPCKKFISSTGEAGFDSGFVPGAADGSATFTVTVNDTAPVWVYCRQTGHCGKGMVFAINPVQTSERNFASFQALAIRNNGTGAATPSSGTGSGSSGFTSASVLGGAASIVLIGFGSVVTLLL